MVNAHSNPDSYQKDCAIIIGSSHASLSGEAWTLPGADEPDSWRDLRLHRTMYQLFWIVRQWVMSMS
jgi:hypothetical protein